MVCCALPGGTKTDYLTLPMTSALSIKSNSGFLVRLCGRALVPSRPPTSPCDPGELSDPWRVAASRLRGSPTASVAVVPPGAGAGTRQAEPPTLPLDWLPSSEFALVHLCRTGMSAGCPFSPPRDRTKSQSWRPVPVPWAQPAFPRYTPACRVSLAFAGGRALCWGGSWGERLAGPPFPARPHRCSRHTRRESVTGQ